MKSVHINNNHRSTLTSIRYHMYEYTLVFSCDKVTEALIHNVKHYFKENYGCQQAANLMPHLTLFQCIIHEQKAERIVQGIERVARHVTPFQINLTRFNKYEHGTFYIDLEETATRQILDIVKQLKGDVGNHVKQWAPSEYHFCDDPHLTIARNMNAVQTERAVMDWLYREFLASFPASEMQLLRRSLIHGAKFETIARFPFMSLPKGQYVQASLF